LPGHVARHAGHGPGNGLALLKNHPESGWFFYVEKKLKSHDFHGFLTLFMQRPAAMDLIAATLFQHCPGSGGIHVQNATILRFTY